MHIEIPVTGDPNYKPKSLVDGAYEHGRKAAAEEFLKYIRDIVFSDIYDLPYDLYEHVRDWAIKTFDIIV